MSDLFRVPKRWFAMGAAVAVLVAASPAASADDDEDGAALPNGGFETGTLAHWRVSEVGNDGEGWSADRGTTSPVVGFPIPGPPQGMWQAVSDQSGPGSHVLYRDIRVRDDD